MHRIRVHEFVDEFFMKSLLSRWVSSIASVTLLATASSLVAGELPEKYKFVQDLFPTVEITDIRPSPVAGLLEMAVGADIFYLSEDGKFLLQGELYDIVTKKNLSEVAKESARMPYFNRFGDDQSILFAAANPVAEIMVFTDIDCGYCRKLHRDIQGYNDNGISIRYVFFPRSGPATESWRKAQDVWCAVDRRDALTKAKNNQDFSSNKPCDASIIAEHYKVVEELGLTGTPALLTESGRLIVGYRSPDELLKLLQDDS